MIFDDFQRSALNFKKLQASHSTSFQHRDKLSLDLVNVYYSFLAKAFQ